MSSEPPAKKRKVVDANNVETVNPTIALDTDKDYIAFCNKCYILIPFDLSECSKGLCEYGHNHCEAHAECYSIKCPSDHSIPVSTVRNIFWGGPADLSVIKLFCTKCGEHYKDGDCKCPKISR